MAERRITVSVAGTQVAEVFVDIRPEYKASVDVDDDGNVSVKVEEPTKAEKAPRKSRAKK